MQQVDGYILVSWVYITNSLCLVVNRLLVRAYGGSRRHPLNIISDILVVLAWCFVAGQASCDLLMRNDNALGKTEFDLEDPEGLKGFLYFLKIGFVENVIYYIPLYCIKGAILCFLMETTPTSLPKVRRAILCGMCLAVFGFLFTELVYLFRCIPMSDNWSLNPTCNQRAVFILGNFAVGYHMALDVYIYCIPFFLLKHLRATIPKSKLASVYVMFGLGFVLVVASIGQLIPDSYHGNIGVHLSSYWWGMHELNLAIVIACLPALRITFHHLRQRYFGKGSDMDSDGSPRPHRRKVPFVVRLKRGELTTREVAGTSERKVNASEKKVATSYHDVATSYHDVGTSFNEAELKKGIMDV